MNRVFFIVFFLFLSTGCISKTTPKNELFCIQVIDRNGVNETISSSERLKKFENINFLEAQPYKQVTRIYENNVGNKSSIITSYHENGQIYQRLEAVNGRALGKYQEWHPDGKLAIEAMVIEGAAGLSTLDQESWLFDGQTTAWDKEGNLEALYHYEKGVLEGESLFYYPSGALKRKELYLAGELTGQRVFYFEDGKVQSLEKFLNGKLEGGSFLYNQEGKLLFSENYSNGDLLSGLYFDPFLKEVSRIDSGDGFKTLFQGDERSVFEYKKGRLEGLISYYHKGVLFRSYQVKEGKKNGEEIRYYADGKTPRLSIFWRNDSIEGEVKTWYPDGGSESQKEVYNNKKNGFFTAWYQDGSLMFVEEYEKDRLQKGSYYKIHEKIPVSSVVAGNGFASLYDQEGRFLKSIRYINGEPEEE